MTSSMLRAEFQVLPANSGKNALALLQRNDVPMDLVLLDLDMPIISGFEVLKAIKNDSKLRHLPVIILTRNADQDSVTRAIQSGATAYIVKPFTADIQKQKLRAALSNADK